MYAVYTIWLLYIALAVANCSIHTCMLVSFMPCMAVHLAVACAASPNALCVV